MSEILLNEARNFLIASLRGKKANYETLSPWRKNWEFVVLHSFRVENYILRILEGERQAISKSESLVLQLAAILHDVGRIEGTQDHAKRSAAIVRTWLTGETQIAEQIPDLDKLYELIETHSDKISRPNDFITGVLKDADILDEIGAMSIFMAQNRPMVDRASPFFFHQLEDHLIKQEIPYCVTKMELLNTQTARNLLTQRITFIRSFINQLHLEMLGTEVIRDL